MLRPREVLASASGLRYSLIAVERWSASAELEAARTIPGAEIGMEHQAESATRDAGPSYARGFVLEGERNSLRRLISDVWRSAELIRTLARKDFFVVYRRASFGVIWSVAVPALQAAVMSVILTRFVRFGEISHYPVYVFSGIVAWSFFSGALTAGTTSIVDGGDLST